MKVLSIFLASFSMIFTQSIFFSEYAEGSSNNKYLEIYNPTNESISLEGYAFPSTANDPSVPGEHEYWNTFDSGATVAPGDVYVICHGSSDDIIQAECDQFHTYLSNGDDGYALVYGTEDDFEAIDWIGNWDADPGTGWDVCGVTNGTKEHTLVRVSTVNSGNDWAESSDEENCEWLIYPQDTWIYLGSHPHNDDDPIFEDCSNGIDDDGDGFIDCDDWDCDGSIGDVDPNCDDGTPSEDCSNGVDDDGDGFIDCDDFDCFNDNNCDSGDEDCSNGVDDDGDGFVDCDDFDCDDDLACDNGGSGSCAEYGCVGYTPENFCQCNDQCVEYNNCCDDYEDVCGDIVPSSEDCGNGVDDDGDGFVDCDDFDCDDDPDCGGGSSEDCSNGIDDDGDTYIDCNDFDCTGDPNCPSEDCSNGVDDDDDGYVDCNDFDCDDDPACVENCTNGIDDDLDGYVDCDDDDCNGDPTCYNCDDGMVELFFSEYAEGSSNNKYLEIYNPSGSNVDLSCYAYPNATNGGDEGSYDYWNAFDNGAVVSAGGVYVICHSSSDEFILNECDETHPYLSNGDDGIALVYGSQNEFEAIDWIGDWGDDPGNGWDVCGVSDGTKDHTLVRNSGIFNGNDWLVSSNEATCEWQVLDQNTWDNLGFHIADPNANISPSADAGEDLVVSGGDVVTLDGSNSSDSDGAIVAYIWSQISGTTVSLSSYEEPIVTFTAPEEGTLEFELQVYDNEGAVGTATVAVLISGGSMSISDIQETNEQGSGDDCYPSPYLGQVVTVTGVVTAVKPGSNPNFYFQDIDSDVFSGVYVYDNSIAPELGDELLLTVEVEEYYGLTELTNSVSSVVLSTGNFLEPTYVTTADLAGGCSFNAEQYEGMLVNVENATVISEPNEYGEWTVNDGSGECLIDDYFFDGTMDFYSVGSTITSITGVVNYAYGDYRMLPRNSDDINVDDESCTADADVNLDGSTDVLDVVQVVGAILGTVDFNADQECISDINSDGSVDVLDIVMIVDLILNIASQNSDPLIIEKNMIDIFINANKNNSINR